ncbi:UNVERIFIED_CONTAM: hypothetical protein GTU68_009380, partial [Idotea baltica]|nr:hypothetical protein [Idotea baltica]
VQIATSLFDLLSATSDVDHPLCEDCTDFLLSALDESLSRTERQSAVYEPLFAQGHEADSGREVCHGLEAELEGLRAEEARIVRQLGQLEEERAGAQMVLDRCKEERRQLEEESTSYWREFCRYRCRVTGLEDENRSVKSRTSHLQHQLDSLRKTNVFNATFAIWYSGHFATINGLRLGRLPTAPVAWPEINAAWGQTALLLAALARKVNLSFSRYRVVPHGSTSYIEQVIGENKEIPLYGSAGLRFLRDNKFDAGMAAFVECAAEFQTFVEASGAEGGVGGGGGGGWRGGAEGGRKKFTLPYRINGHCMEDTSGQLYSVK